LRESITAQAEKSSASIVMGKAVGVYLTKPQKAINAESSQDSRIAKTLTIFSDTIIDFVKYARARTTFEDRLSAQVCELCGKTDVPLEMHHVNKVKNLKGKQFWEIVMIAKKRKTLAVCKNCHHKIHHP
jgi:ribosomal protein L32